MKEETHTDPSTQDGRNVSSDLGELIGEGSHQRVCPPPSRDYPTLRETSHEIPSVDTRLQKSPTYYDEPAIKEPVWKWTIPAYFYTGGLAGTVATLGAAVTLFGDPSLQPLAKRCQWIGTVGAMTSAGLLIADLGMPRRFLYMLRVFRVTSPMNVGTWILTPFGASTTAAALFDGLPNALGRWGRRGAIVAGTLGGPLSAYTAVLISNTAVPAWQGVRRTLPLLFAASGTTSAASALDLLRGSPQEHGIVKRFGLLAKTAELLCAELVHRELARQPRSVLPLQTGIAGTLWKASKWCVAASLVTSLLSGGSPRRRRMSGWLGTLGSIGLRFAIFRAGIASSRDPRATFEAQRAATTPQAALPTGAAGTSREGIGASG